MRAHFLESTNFRAFVYEQPPKQAGCVDPPAATAYSWRSGKHVFKDLSSKGPNRHLLRVCRGAILTKPFACCRGVDFGIQHTAWSHNDSKPAPKITTCPWICVDHLETCIA